MDYGRGGTGSSGSSADVHGDGGGSGRRNGERSRSARIILERLESLDEISFSS